MDVAKPFFKFLNKYIVISEEEYLAYIAPFVKVRKFAKKDIISKEGEVENFFNFIIKGIAIKYYSKEDEQYNTQISSEGHIIQSQVSFHTKTPSDYAIVAIEPCTLISISYDDLQKLFSQSIKMERMGRLVVTSTLVLQNKWHMQMIKMSPRDRFVRFVHYNPKLIQRVPQKELASYLNIKPETFSRFKHLIKDRKKPLKK